MSTINNSNSTNRNTKLPTANLEPRVIIATSSKLHQIELEDYCKTLNYYGFNCYLINSENDNSIDGREWLLKNIYSTEAKIILVVEHLNSFIYLYNDIVKLNSLLERGRLDIHLPLQETIIKQGLDNASRKEWQLIVTLAKDTPLETLLTIPQELEKFKKYKYKVHPHQLTLEVMGYIKAQNKARLNYEDENDSDYSNNAVVVTFSELLFLKLSNYCNDNKLQIIGYFGAPEKESIFELIDFIKEQREKKTIIVIDGLDSLGGMVYRDMPILDLLLSKDRIEVHIPLENAVITRDKFSEAKMRWDLLAILANSYSVFKPEIELEDKNRQEIERLVEEMMNQQFKISKSLQDKALDNIEKAIGYMAVQDNQALTILYDEIQTPRQGLLRLLNTRRKNIISDSEYSGMREVLKKQAKEAIDALNVSFENVTNFSDAALDLMDIVLKGSEFYSEAKPEKKRQILSLIFSKLELVDGKLDCTIRPAFMEFFISLLPD